MGKWQWAYTNVPPERLDDKSQLAGTRWLDAYLPKLQPPPGAVLDVGCGLGAEMLRLASCGYTPAGLDLEPAAVAHVRENYEFEVAQHDFREPLPFEDARFAFALSRLAIHFLPPAGARAVFAEIRRVLQPGGHLLFVVNSETHRRRGLQYDYSGAIELEPGYWQLPKVDDRAYLFYTPELAKQLAGNGWNWLQLEESAFSHWGGIEKQVVIGLAEKVAAVGSDSS